MAGALDGMTVIELAAIGPVPFAGMMLADHGARVIQIARPGPRQPGDFGGRDVLNRNRELRTVDLKSAAGIDEVRGLVRGADALIEGFRPGVLERMGLDPDALLAENPALVVGRMTGWGQDGPKARLAGHDINYIALAGALHTYGREGQPPTFPLNMVGDYGGGGMLLAFGVLAGVLSARATGKGQVIDCAMVDGAALLSSITWSLLANGMWRDERGVNLLDSGAPYYETYETADGKWLAVGPIETQFYAILVERLGLAHDAAFADRDNPARWRELKDRLRGLFRTRTRDEWCTLLEDSDACVAPVLSLGEAPNHPHNQARGTFIEAGGIVQPAPAPRFSRTPAGPVTMSTP